MPYWGWILVGLAAVVLVVAVFAAMRLGRTRRLQHAFGSEYDRALDGAGSRSEAEAELRGRQKRHESLDVRPLDVDAREDYLDRWRAAQERFLDDPRREHRGRTARRG